MKQVTMIREAGKIPAVHVTFYKGSDKPEVKLGEGERVSFLRFKKSGSDEEGYIQRESMAVVVNKLSVGKVRDCDRGTEFLEALIVEAQDAALKQVADGRAEFQTAQDAAELIREYFDNTRTASGNRVTAESVGKFFDSTIAGWLEKRIAAKFPQFAAEKVAKVGAQYRQSFSELAKYQMPHTKAVYKLLEKCWNEFLAEAVDQEFDVEMADWINARMKKLDDRLNAEEMLLEAI